MYWKFKSAFLSCNWYNLAKDGSLMKGNGGVGLLVFLNMQVGLNWVFSLLFYDLYSRGTNRRIPERVLRIRYSYWQITVHWNACCFCLFSRSFEEKQRATAQGLYSSFKVKQVVAMACFLQEVIGVTGPLSRYLQNAVVDFGKAIDR